MKQSPRRKDVLRAVHDPEIKTIMLTGVKKTGLLGDTNFAIMQLTKHKRWIESVEINNNIATITTR
jgi:hypothetical protein